MEQLVDQGFVVLGGPLADGERVGLAVEEDSQESVRKTLGDDPWSISHLAARGGTDACSRRDVRLCRGIPPSLRVSAGRDSLLPRDETPPALKWADRLMRGLLPGPLPRLVSTAGVLPRPSMTGYQKPDRGQNPRATRSPTAGSPAARANVPARRPEDLGAPCAAHRRVANEGWRSPPSSTQRWTVAARIEAVTVRGL